MRGDPASVDILVEPVEGWRTWNLSLDTSGDPLLHSARPSSDVWLPRQPIEARCTASPILSLFRRPHDAPNAACTCGIYAARSLESMDRPRPAWAPPPVVGTVSLWGRIVEHELGWRAAFAYPSRLRLVCAMCAWFEPGPGKPVTVHTLFRRLYTLCDMHRGGIQIPDGRRSKSAELDPGELQARLLEAYAVDLLPLERVESLFRQPRTPDPPPYAPTIRSVPIQGT